MGKFEEEWQKMLRGERYDAFMPEFYERLVRTREILQDYNNTAPADAERLTAILRGLLGSCGERITVNQPFRCDYGCNIHVGEDFVANFNFTVLDEAEVRDAFIECAEPVTIGDSVWIGGGTTILPGVTIGDNVVIGAGSVVTRDIPSNSLAVGNPARVIRSLPC